MLILDACPSAGKHIEAAAVDDETNEQITALVGRFARAQEAGDVGALESMLVDEFTLVGPSGRMVDKKRLLKLFRSGALTVRVMKSDEVRVKGYGTMAIATGCQMQLAQYWGRSADGSFRFTQVAVRRGHGWQLAAVHLSPLLATSAPVPSRPEATRIRRLEGNRHTVESDDQLIEEVRAGLVLPDDPDPVAALLARWRLTGRTET
jgi:ketosteroid isomerase-like protein